MKLKAKCFDVMPMRAVGVAPKGKTPNGFKKAMWSANLQVAQHMWEISNGDHLHLSMMLDSASDADDESFHV